MRVTLTDDEALDVRVAIRVMLATYGELISMCPDKDSRSRLTGSVMRLADVNRKLGG